MRRREFIGLVGSVAAAWPVAASAQQPDRMRRVGLLSGGPRMIRKYRPVSRHFMQALQQMGWTDGRNVRIDYRWGEGNADTIRKSAAELVALSPDVILTPGGPALERLRQVTRTMPIVFVITPDPVGSGLVESLSRPGGNATGFMQFEYNLCAKWLELLKQIAPGMTRAAVLRDPATPQTGSVSSPSFSPRRRRSAWKSSRSTCATRPRSSAPSRPSRSPAMAA